MGIMKSGWQKQHLSSLSLRIMSVIHKVVDKDKENRLQWINLGLMPDISLDLMKSASLYKPSWKMALQAIKSALDIAFQAKV